MDAADFKGLVSDQWHVGVVGTLENMQLFMWLIIMYIYMIAYLSDASLHFFFLQRTTEESGCSAQQPLLVLVQNPTQRRLVLPVQVSVRHNQV